MTPKPATVMALLPHASDLAGACDPDITTVLKLLDHLPVGDFDVQTRCAVKHARLVAETSGISANHMAVARFALARLIVMLEQHMAVVLS